jgi:hypothetical protein
MTIKDLKMINKKSLAILALLLGLGAISGCDQIRSKIAQTINPKTPDEINREALAALDANQPGQALELTKPLLVDPKKAPPDILLTTARAYAALGDVQQTISLLQILVDSQFTQKQDLLVDDGFSSIRTDIRFVSWAASGTGPVSRANSNPDVQAPGGVNANTGAGVSATINSDSVGASAGGVSVKIGN